MSARPEDDRQEVLRTRLRELGFDEVRFASVAATPPPTPGGSRSLSDWLQAGRHGDMQWMERTADKRRDPGLVLSGTRSIILLGVNYWKAPDAAGRTAPRWARYALHEDYHDTIKPALVAAGRTLEAVYGVTGKDYRYYVDTGPIIERGWAARAGLGFIGKNAMLISRRYGNWLLLATILTRIDLVPDPAIRKRLTMDTGETPDRAAARAAAEVPRVGLLCGKCTRCLDACPTNAFAEPGVVDARRCISYQTIENKGVIPRELRTGIGRRIYGCDICLEVCPWNRFAQEGRRLLLASRSDMADLSLSEILALTPERFAAVFRRTPIKRLKLAGLLRNACIVAGNSGDAGLVPPLTTLATSHASALVRAHAVWAVFRLGGGAGLTRAREREQDPTVLAEYAAESRGVSSM